MMFVTIFQIYIVVHLALFLVANAGIIWCSHDEKSIRFYQQLATYGLFFLVYAPLSFLWKKWGC